ncbi:hypothetical protein [Kitasatospora sp. NPDC056800]|uniref:hypothetical protein n=1 Tax=Kitasatospora sp. NPDC056800 TaxID=3345948 RepID=UPI0036CA7784
MTTTVKFTTVGLADANLLRGRGKKSFETWVIDLAQRGCRALDYRLTGTAPVDRLCVKHLFGQLRTVVSFDDEGVAWIVAVGPHDENDAERNIYTRLWKLCGLDAPPTGERTKPSCCGSGGTPPEFAEEVDDLVIRCNQTVRRRR